MVSKEERRFLYFCRKCGSVYGMTFPYDQIPCPCGRVIKRSRQLTEDECDIFHSNLEMVLDEHGRTRQKFLFWDRGTDRVEILNWFDRIYSGSVGQ